MAKQEILDEEKRARTNEMQKTGLQMCSGVDIPFGVRAIQCGVEVDGIWISRPNTSNSTLVGDAEAINRVRSRLDDMQSVRDDSSSDGIAALEHMDRAVTALYAQGTYQPFQSLYSGDNHHTDAASRLKGRTTPSKAMAEEPYTSRQNEWTDEVVDSHDFDVTPPTSARPLTPLASHQNSSSYQHPTRSYAPVSDVSLDPSRGTQEIRSNTFA